MGSLMARIKGQQLGQRTGFRGIILLLLIRVCQAHQHGDHALLVPVACLCLPLFKFRHALHMEACHKFTAIERGGGLQMLNQFDGITRLL